MCTWKLISRNLDHQCRQDNNLHMGPTYSAQSRGLESAIKVSPNMTFFYPIKLKNYARRIKSRFSEVLRTLPYPFQKIQLILTILMVVSLFPYLFWGMRNRSCHFSVYMLFLRIPGHIRTYYISLERNFQGEYSAVGIVGNGSVGTELFKEQA